MRPWVNDMFNHNEVDVDSSNHKVHKNTSKYKVDVYMSNHTVDKDQLGLVGDKEGREKHQQ